MLVASARTFPGQAGAVLRISSYYTAEISPRELLGRTGQIIGKQPVIVDKAEPEKTSTPFLTGNGRFSLPNDLYTGYTGCLRVENGSCLLL
jgi:hypothetical protein